MLRKRGRPRRCGSPRISQSVKLKADETAVFSYVVYKSRAQRDRIMTKLMKDPRPAAMMDPKSMPFDGKRMFWGGFKTLVRL